MAVALVNRWGANVSTKPHSNIRGSEESNRENRFRYKTQVPYRWEYTLSKSVWKHKSFQGAQTASKMGRNSEKIRTNKPSKWQQ